MLEKTFTFPLLLLALANAQKVAFTEYIYLTGSICPHQDKSHQL